MRNATLRIALLEPSPYIGGMSVAGGIGLRDLGNETTFHNTIGYTWSMVNSKYYGIPFPLPSLLLCGGSVGGRDQLARLDYSSIFNFMRQQACPILFIKP